MTVSHLGQVMTSLELEEWKAYYTLLDEKAQRNELAARAQEGLRARRAGMRGR